MRNMRSLVSVLIAMALTLMPMFNTRASGQATAGGTRGVVLDVNGAVVPSAPIIATNVATGVEYRATATSEGRYAIPRIQACLHLFSDSSESAAE